MTLQMTRRTVLKAIGAALMAPCVQLRQEIDRERLMLAFCDDQPYRWDFEQPFGVGSLTYATDSRHMVRAEIANRVENGERRLPKTVDDVWRQFWVPGEFRPFELPPIESLKLSGHPRWGGTCPVCDDRRISYGAFYPDQDAMHDLVGKYSYDPDDNTYRDPSCQRCLGLSWLGPSELLVCGVRMTYSRMKVVATLPNVMVAPNLSGQPDAPLLFQADGFEGMTMGVWHE